MKFDPVRPVSLREKLTHSYRKHRPLDRFLASCSPIQFWRFLTHINWHTLREVITKAAEQRLPSLAAEMAYNAMLSLFPGILALLTAIGLYESLQVSFNLLALRLSELAPDAVLILIQNFVTEVSTSQNRSLFSLSFALAIWASSAAISAAMRALDQIHEIPLRQTRPFWKAKLVSLALTIGTILLLMLASSLVLISDLVVHNVAKQGYEMLGYWVLSTWRLLSWPLALGMVSAAFAFIYRFGPSRWTPGKPLFQGAILAALSWAGLSAAFRLYVSHFGNYNRVYGAVGTVIILMLWLYLTALVLLLGDQMNVIVGKAMDRQESCKSG